MAHPAGAVPRERWATKIGLILALAGNAIGLGNLLRFPRQAALNGGGAFMIPYFVCLLAIGIPLLWIECAIGRYGGRNRCGHTAGMFELLWRHPIAKYVGALGLFIPFTVAIYYVYVESWCLAYSFFSLGGRYFGLNSVTEMSHFLAGFQGTEQNSYFHGLGTAYVFFGITFVLNLLVLLGGVARGIERLALLALPLLFVVGIGLVVRVLTLSPPAGAAAGQTVLDGLGFVWNPKLGALADPDVWLAAAGQVFFTLSVGWGIIHTYASYIPPEDDVALTGLSTASLNEFAEVVLGGTIALTAAVVFFGASEATSIAQGGSFDLGFDAMPLVMERIPGGQVFGALWFLLLFFAGITSSVALMQPVLALLQDDLGVPRRRAVVLAGIALFVCSQPVILFLGHGFLDQLDFWAGSFALLVFGFLEVLVFAWVFGMERGWEEITRGAQIRLPRFYRTVMAFVMPLALGAILVFWSVRNLLPELGLAHTAPEDRPYVWGARLLMALILIVAFVAARAASRARERRRAQEAA
jgi:NSS family neurotransmitter:Na+ symporter